MKIHESAEDYLEAILKLRENHGMVRSIDIAREPGFSKPSISAAMRNLLKFVQRMELAFLKYNQ